MKKEAQNFLSFFTSMLTSSKYVCKVSWRGEKYYTIFKEVCPMHTKTVVFVGHENVGKFLAKVNYLRLLGQNRNFHVASEKLTVRRPEFTRETRVITWWDSNLGVVSEFVVIWEVQNNDKHSVTKTKSSGND